MATDAFLECKIVLFVLWVSCLEHFIDLFTADQVTPLFKILIWSQDAISILKMLLQKVPAIGGFLEGCSTSNY